MDHPTLRAKIKVWEEAFEFEYGRKPSSTDIKIRPTIFAAYKQYYKGKKDKTKSAAIGPTGATSPTKQSQDTPEDFGGSQVQSQELGRSEGPPRKSTVPKETRPSRSTEFVYSVDQAQDNASVWFGQGGLFDIYFQSNLDPPADTPNPEQPATTTATTSNGVTETGAADSNAATAKKVTLFETLVQSTHEFAESQSRNSSQISEKGAKEERKDAGESMPKSRATKPPTPEKRATPEKSDTKDGGYGDQPAEVDPDDNSVSFDSGGSREGSEDGEDHHKPEFGVDKYAPGYFLFNRNKPPVEEPPKEEGDDTDEELDRLESEIRLKAQIEAERQQIDAEMEADNSNVAVPEGGWLKKRKRLNLENSDSDEDGAVRPKPKRPKIVDEEKPDEPKKTRKKKTDGKRENFVKMNLKGSWKKGGNSKWSSKTKR